MRPGSTSTTVERFRTYEEEGHADGVFDAFFSAATAALILIDEDLRCVRVNERLAALTGRPTSAHVGHPVADVLPAELEPKLTEVLSSGRAIEKLPFELGGRSLVGTFFPVYADARITGAGGILIDITEHKRLERELRASIELRERVLAVVSHDLRNPLGTIALAMSTMPSTAREDGGIAKRVDIAERATRVMETLIHDLLDIATIQTGKLTPQLTDETVDAVLEEAIALHAPLAHEKGLTLVDNTRLAGVQLRCDRTRMMQLLGNLLGNAIKFCRKGDIITLGGSTDDHALRLQISDTGPGIPPDDIPHLFEPYWSTARSRQRGTGLGLFICSAIVEAHGGQLTVESCVGAGTTFHIALPLG
jgi:PAS domain S-box-containing protein